MRDAGATQRPELLGFQENTVRERESPEGGASVSQAPEEEAGYAKSQRHHQVQKSGGGNGCCSVKEQGQRTMLAGPE